MRPKFAGFVQGMLFAVDGPIKPQRVPVPIDHGILSLRSTDDLAVEYWVKPLDDSIWVQEADENRAYFTTYPMSHKPIENPFTIYFEGHDIKGRDNEAVCHMWGHSFRGNILVIKHSADVNKQSTAHIPVDVVASDLKIVQKLLIE
ncbi:hypothetical protein DXG01_012980 [Tephrocybe rancida]|nr:hypothetical protein DXG01_012980 [Tephrocybe rancida]